MKDIDVETDKQNKPKRRPHFVIERALGWEEVQDLAERSVEIRERALDNRRRRGALPRLPRRRGDERSGR